VRTDLLHPKHWPLWGGLAILRSILWLPRSLQLAIGRGFGRVLYLGARRSRHITEVNLELCFSDETPARRKRLVKEHFEALGIGAIECAMCWWGQDEELQSLCEVEGLEHVEKARADGRGILIMSTHATCSELCARLLHKHVQFDAIIYKPLKNPVLDYVSTRYRSEAGGAMVARKDIREAIRTMSHGGTGLCLMDHTEGSKRSVLVPFFGEPKTMPTGPIRMVEMTGAVAIPVLMARKPGTAGYRLILRPPLGDFPSKDTQADALQLIHCVEEQVELAPEQYSWAHPRFRKRRGTLPSPYRL
jgi:KDO2-lipid IV(A) lauroyltransferase